MNTNLRNTAFREGDEVVLIAGTYQGTPGQFLRLRTDLGWADILERNGSIRSHPVAWLGHIGATRNDPQPPLTKWQKNGAD